MLKLVVQPYFVGSLGCRILRHVMPIAINIVFPIWICLISILTKHQGSLLYT